RPPARHACIPAARLRSLERTYARKAGQSQYAARNTARGAVAPSKIGRGGVPGGRTNAPAAPSRKTVPNHSASTPKIILRMLGPESVGDVCVGVTRAAEACITAGSMMTLLSHSGVASSQRLHIPFVANSMPRGQRREHGLHSDLARVVSIRTVSPSRGGN